MNAIDPGFLKRARAQMPGRSPEPPPHAISALAAATRATRVYRLVPNASPDDLGWGGTFHHGEIVVRARSSGEARAIAARAEAAAAGEPVRTTTQVVASALREPRLYSVRRDGSGRFPDEGEPEVLAGAFRIPDGVVLHGD